MLYKCCCGDDKFSQYVPCSTLSTTRALSSDSCEPKWYDKKNHSKLCITQKIVENVPFLEAERSNGKAEYPRG